jgi:hypothetical protein
MREFIQANPFWVMSLCGQFLLPVLGVALGIIGGLSAAGFVRCLGWIGLILSFASGVTFFVVIIDFLLFHSKGLVG